MAEDAITLDERDEVTVVRMDDGKVNALSTGFLEQLGIRVGDAVDTGKPIVLAGSERCFSAGLDLEEVPTLDRDGLARLFGGFDDVVVPILEAPVPVVAAVEGFAIAGGAIIALACDHRIAHPEAEIGATELDVGIPFPPSDLTLLTERLPAGTIRRTILDPRRTSGDEALQLGWVDELADDPLSSALEAVDRIGGPNEAAFRDLKRQLNGRILDAWHGLDDEERRRYLDMLTSKATQAAVLEGIRNKMGD